MADRVCPIGDPITISSADTPGWLDAAEIEFGSTVRNQLSFRSTTLLWYRGYEEVVTKSTREQK
jgi:hypothetical protein